MAGRNAINDSADRLSDLPDTLLCHILSFIDTKYAVATSILSKRWKHVYISVPNIILDDSLTRDTKNEQSFTVFIMFGLKQILMRTVPHINLFRLKCDFIFKYHLIKTLVCAAIFHNVKELDICICMEDGGNVTLPPEVFTSGSLVVLKLTGYDETSKLRGDDEPSVELVVPDLVSLPKLKVLYLGALVLDDINRLFQGCKLLEDLCLSHCLYLVDAVDFSFPLLRKLSLKSCDANYYNVECTEFVIDAPNLEVFEHGGEDGNYLLRMKKPMSDGIAKFDFFETHFENLLQFIIELCGIKSLYLSHLSKYGFRSNCHQLSSFKAPAAFKTLTRLELHAFALDILPNALEFAEKLEVLVINKAYEFIPVTCPDLPETVPICLTYEFTPVTCPALPKTVPICLTEHLRNIEFIFFVSSEPEIEHDIKTMKYFLQNGKVLERMKISITRWWYSGYDSDSTRSPRSIRRSVRKKLEILRGFSKRCELDIKYGK